LYYFLCELRDCCFAAAHALKVIDKEGRRIIDVLAIFSQLVPQRRVLHPT